jgi:hypothetical protein
VKLGSPHARRTFPGLLAQTLTDPPGVAKPRDNPARGGGDVKVWRREDTSWQQVPITDEGLSICPAKGAARLLNGAARQRPLARLVRFEEDGVPRAALLSSQAGALRVNGFPPLDVHVLEEADEIGMPNGGDVLYFSGASQPEVGRFAATDEEQHCARCSDPIRDGDVAVRCACRAWMHAGERARAPTEVRNCADYDERCPACGQRREQMAWTPEDLDA